MVYGWKSVYSVTKVLGEDLCHMSNANYKLTLRKEGFGETLSPPKTFFSTRRGLRPRLVEKKKGSWRARYPLGGPPNLPHRHHLRKMSYKEAFLDYSSYTSWDGRLGVDMGQHGAPLG
jgi:hypothetical protein